MKRPGKAVEYVRQRKGPALIHAHVIRPYSHSLSDDERLYKSEEVRQQEARRDPLTRFAQPAAAGKAGRRERIEGNRGGRGPRNPRSGGSALWPLKPASPHTVMQYLYSPSVDPTSSQFDRRRNSMASRSTMVDLINVALRDEMARDPRVVVFGEDVADCGHEDELSKVKGKGGVFKVTHGLQRHFGSARCYNSQLAEASIVGRAMGMATRGLETGGRNPVLRLYLAGHDADSRRTDQPALALQQRLLLPDRHPRAHRRVPGGRRDLSQPVRRIHLYPLAGLAGGDAGDGAGCQRPAAYRHPLRRSRPVPRAEAPLSPDP